MRIVGITRDYMVRNMDKFLGIERNWTDIGEAPWKKENFLLDLPLKWSLSFAAEKEGSIIGYIIGSECMNKVSGVNKIVVDYPYRGRGVGKQLMDRYFEACLERRVGNSELKALAENESANRFYSKQGYQPIGSVEGTDGKMRVVYEKRLNEKVKTEVSK